MTEDIEITDWGKNKVLWINSDKISECKKIFESHSDTINGIGLSPYSGFLKNDLNEIIQHFSFVEGLIIQYGKDLNISGIENFTNLKYISISDNNQAIDFSNFSNLEEIRVQWHSNMNISEKCQNIKHLYLREYKPKSKNLSELSHLTKLEYLGIVQSPINSLKGIQDLINLNTLELFYCSKLTNLDELKSDSIEILVFDHCKKIADHEQVKSIKPLKVLKYLHCGPIKSIGFLHEMLNLEEFRFGKSHILDGDLTSCFNLKSVGFQNKKHYSHTADELRAILKEKNVTGSS